MEDKYYYILIALMLVVTLIQAVVGLYLKQKDNKIKETDKIHTLGTVVKYASNEAHAPVVEYVVNGLVYKKALKYSYITTSSNSFNKVETSVKGDVLDTKLRLRTNSAVSINRVMKTRFPIGSTMDVYYAIDNPKIAYVERYAPSYTGNIMLISALATGLIGVITLALFVR